MSKERTSLANLIGSNFDELPCSVSLTPVPPGSTDQEDAYQVVISVAGTTLLDQQFNVHGWQLGHSHFLRLARMFMVAPNLIGKKTDISVGASPKSREPVVLQEGVPWFLVRIYGAVSRIGRF